MAGREAADTAYRTARTYRTDAQQDYVGGEGMRSGKRYLLTMCMGLNA